MNRTAALCALLSAALLGISTPAAKALAGRGDPILRAACSTFTRVFDALCGETGAHGNPRFNKI